MRNSEGGGSPSIYLAMISMVFLLISSRCCTESGTICWKTAWSKCLWPLRVKNFAAGTWEYGVPLGIIVVETREAYNGFFLDWRGSEEVKFGAAELCLPESNSELNVVEHPDGLRLNESEVEKEPWGHTEKGYSWGLLFFSADSGFSNESDAEDTVQLGGKHRDIYVYVGIRRFSRATMIR